MNLCRFCGMESCFVHCVHCGTELDTEHPRHATACPFRTNVWPVSGEEDLPGDGMLACCNCSEPFVTGDSYTLKFVKQDIWTGARTYEIWCLGCAAVEVAKRAT